MQLSLQHFVRNLGAVLVAIHCESTHSGKAIGMQPVLSSLLPVQVQLP
jgi:hypothetical protein